MAKKSMLEREKKRTLLVKKYIKKRTIILSKLKIINNNIIVKNKLLTLLEKLPKNSSIQRLKNRCWKTGKPRGFIRYFGLCRNAFRELALNCFLPGVIKSSW